eukprot:TRINITY_DN30543_c0_g1_i1.p1 TRINITY_DN30543_c0_g1~~TRINITY_DN30543_c0_g1_i1.p1  ORF type:complete len:548 (-),score=80.05 TRINITY_DN30543_c0_g1_i1:194-1837(-)
MAERRVDPSDAKSYAKKDFKRYYSGKLTNAEISAYWEECMVVVQSEGEIVEWLRSHLAKKSLTQGRSWLGNALKKKYRYNNFRDLAGINLVDFLKKYDLWGGPNIDPAQRKDPSQKVRSRDAEDSLRSHSKGMIGTAAMEAVDKKPARSHAVEGRGAYFGEISVIGSTHDADAISERFMAAVTARPILSVDSEWSPDRCKKHDHPIALVSVATWDHVYLFRTTKSGVWFPDCVRRCLQDPGVAKVVFAPNEDRKKFARTFALVLEFSEAEGFLDLAACARELRFPCPGLKQLAIWYGLDIEKPAKVSTSNWEAKELLGDQLEYAAEDVWVPLLLVGHLLQEPGICLSGLRTQVLETWRECRKCLQARFRPVVKEGGATVAQVEQVREALMDLPPVEQICLPESFPWVVPRGLPPYFGKHWYKAHRADFAFRNVDQKRNKYLVRIRAPVERARPLEHETTYPWGTNQTEAMTRWVADQLHRIQEWAADLPEEVILDFLNTRLQCLSDVFWEQRLLAPYAATRNAVVSVKAMVVVRRIAHCDKLSGTDP